MRHLMAAAIIFACSTGQAAVVPFSYSYTWESGNSISGILEGELQSDNDTVVVSSIVSTVYSAYETLEFYSGPTSTNLASLSGLVLSVGLPGPAVTGKAGWIINRAEIPDMAIIASPFPSCCTSLETEEYVAARWTLTAVPLPAAGWFIATGVCLLFPLVKRRARA